MKFLKIILLFCYSLLVVYCEIPPPPPSPSSLFRPSPHLSTVYGPPSPSINVGLNSKLTIEQLIRITEQLQNSAIQQQQNIYTQPQRRPQLPQGIANQINRPFPTNFRPPQQQYGVPELPKQVLPRPFRRPINIVDNKVTLQTTYGVPSQQPNPPSTQFGPARPLPPATNYGVPDTKNLETFGDLRNSDQSNQDSSKQLLLPRYAAPGNFKPPNKPNQGYLPPQTVSGNNPNNVDVPIDSSDTGAPSFPTNTNKPTNIPQSGYLPPQTTPSTFLSTLAPEPSQKTPTPSTTTASSDYDDYDIQQATQSPLNEDDAENGPNISISNAVAGGGDGYFFVQQPDGRIQRVTLQKFQQPNSKPGEFVAQYYFQNVDVLPNAVYAPLFNLEMFIKK